MSFQANAIIDVIALLIVAIVGMMDRRVMRLRRRSRTLFYALLFLISGVLLTDIPAWLLDGAVFTGSRALSYALNTLYYLFQIAYCYCWLIFSDSWQRQVKAVSPFRLGLFALPMALEAAAILLNPFTGWIFSVNAENVYSRGPFYVVNLIPYYLYILGSLALSVRGYLKAKDAVVKQRNASLIVFMFLPVCGVALESISYGVSWIWPFSALSLMMVYLSVQQQEFAEQRIEAITQREETARLKTELVNSRIAIMLSQIQPHFLYNVLSSIQVLCDKDPVVAKQATAEFTEFLRGNMTSLTADKPIAFKWELEHTNHYLSLEKLRFGSRLAVRYDIRETLFRLPTLTLQPLVENAVRYGVTKRVQGGEVVIATRREDDQFVISVTDNGIGFDPERPHEDGRSHIGIQNVRDRLKSMCNGTLTIVSTPDVGTVATIRLPMMQALEDKQNVDYDAG